MEKQKNTERFQSKLLPNNVFMCRGIYYLYKNKEVVYVGMSTTNCMQRIVMHQASGRKDFDSFQIFGMPKSTDAEIIEKEKRAIQRKLPKYNVAHGSGYGNSYWKREKEANEELAERRNNRLVKKIGYNPSLP
jgi:predicted GIY-YIG superfamily endonuclease